MPGHLDDPFDPTDRSWYKKDNQPRTIKSNISSTPPSSGAVSIASPYSSRVHSSKSPFGTGSTSKTRSSDAPSTSYIDHKHAPRSHRSHRQHNRHDIVQGSSTQPLGDASNSLTRVDPDERRRHMLSPPPGSQQRDGFVLLQGAAGTPPNTTRRGRKSREQRPPTHRSYSTPAGTGKEAMLGWHPTQPLPPGESWYIRRRDPPKPHSKSKLDAKGNKPMRHRRASSGSANATLPAVKKGTGMMKGWYAAVCKKLGVVGADSDGVGLLNSES